MGNTVSAADSIATGITQAKIATATPPPLPAGHRSKNSATPPPECPMHQATTPTPTISECPIRAGDDGQEINPYNNVRK